MPVKTTTYVSLNHGDKLVVRASGTATLLVGGEVESRRVSADAVRNMLRSGNWAKAV